jgi:hypothetical protein
MLIKTDPEPQILAIPSSYLTDFQIPEGFTPISLDELKAKFPEGYLLPVPLDWDLGSFIDTIRATGTPDQHPLPVGKTTHLYSRTSPYAPPGRYVPESTYVRGIAVRTLPYYEPQLLMDREKWQPASAGKCSVGIVVYHQTPPDSLGKWREIGYHQAVYKDDQGNRYRTPIRFSLYQVLNW